MTDSNSISRRGMIRSLMGSSLLMPAIVSELLAATGPVGSASADRLLSSAPLFPKPSHFAPKAKRIIFLYMTGGVSHIESFDPKPKLTADHGKPCGKTRFLKRSIYDFNKFGQSGIEVSTLFPHIGSVADDLCVIRSMKSGHGNHFEATLGIHTGSYTFARPSIGSWISYGLGTFNQNLPSFVVLAPQLPYAGGQVWASDFLPPTHQGTRVVPGNEPIPNMLRRLKNPRQQELQLSLIDSLNKKHLINHNDDPTLAARIRSFETAAGMQSAAPDAFDLSKESNATHALYGLERGSTKGFAWQCLVARRLAERGVRFIELIDTGASNNWDSHGDMKEHGRLAKNVDQPIAALIKDLKSRGMLDDTLVVWTTEFGRTPQVESPTHKGRDHHAGCFSSWLAGGGVKPGHIHGQTDDYGMEITKDKVDVHDFHATILHLMGMDHEKLTYRHAGRDFRLTDVHGNVVRELMA